MKESNIFDDPFVESLRQLNPEIPVETKSRLLYECGMAAAETKIKKQRQRFRTNAILSLLAATGLGFFVGLQFSLPQPTQDTTVAKHPQSTEEIQNLLPAQTSAQIFAQTRNRTTLAVAMPVNRVFELLDQPQTKTQTGPKKESRNVDLSTTITTPLSTLSFLNELN